MTTTDTESYRDTIAPQPWWNPDAERTAEATMRYEAVNGLVGSVRSHTLIRDTSQLGMARLTLNSAAMIASHDRYLLLAKLRELDPAAADELADRIILAAEAGDSYGEWLWQWCTEMGVDAERVCAEVEATPEPEPHPVARVELFTDTTGDHRWRAIARNGEIVATCGEGYRTAAHARAMAERILPGIELRDEEADRG